MNAVRTTMVALLFGVTAVTLNGKPTVIVFPSGPTVPENLLRIELRFSEPLATPLDMQHIRLYGDNGALIADPFLDLPLPSADGKRVMVLLHPGRVKTGVGPNVALGRALHAGSVVTLIVDDPALARTTRKTWIVTPFNAEPPRPSQWRIEPPTQGTRSPVIVHLNEPISSSAEGLIAIRGPDGQRLSGATRLEDGETVWSFTPTHPWRIGVYTVVTNEDLEDPAGNRPGAPFEYNGIDPVRDGVETNQPFEPVLKTN